MVACACILLAILEHVYEQRGTLVDKTGVMTVFYFTYMALFSLSLGVRCGTMGFIGAFFFVHKIYRNIKID